MIALLLPLALQAAVAAPPAANPLPLRPIGRQSLPAKGCSAYLWSTDGRQLVAMVGTEPATLRIAPGDAPVDLPRSDASGTADLGFAATATFRGGDLTVMLDMQVARQEGLTGGAKVPAGTLRVERAGQDTVIVPVAGMIGCAA